MCFGVAGLDYCDGVRHGVCCKFFDYSGRTTISIESFEEKIKEEISRVRALTGKYLPWVMHVHKHDEIYNEDKLIYLKNKLFWGGMFYLGQKVPVWIKVKECWKYEINEDVNEDVIKLIHIRI